MSTLVRFRLCCLAFVFAALLATQVLQPPCAVAQTEAASVSGRVTDQSGAVVPEAEVEIRNVDTNVTQVTRTNGEGLYVFPFLKPGNYLINVRKQGFRTVSVTGITLNVQDNLSRNFVLQVGSSAESITVTAEAANINTTDGSVSTVVDRQFVENLPLNGRSFQALIELTPGVVLTPSTNFSLGQFSVDGQRPSSNYYMVDGVAANIGIIAGSPGQSAAGTAAGLSVQGGTNSLVSVDAMQEFRIQTSTYAPEFGRAPGAQVSIVTRSGTNAFHGALFEYFRNDVLDANNWFNNQAGAKKSAERQNDFGGVIGGPVIKNRTFFFFSYEGLRLRQPQFVKTCVPSAFARAQASPAVRPFLNAYPVANIDQTLTGGPFGNCPPNPPPFPSGVPNFLAELDAGFSDPSTLNATSIRIDHQVNSKLTLFGRYDYAPSNTHQRGGAGVATLSSVAFTRLRTQTVTLGSTWILTPSITNDLRFNFSNNALLNRFDLDTFQGAVVPPDSILFPAGFDHQQSVFLLDLLDANQYFQGKVTESRQRQINLVDSLSWVRGAHTLKVGVDYRRLSPNFSPPPYFQFNESFGAFAASGISLASFVVANRSATLFFHNVGAYAQDTWKASSRLTLTFGLRWDVDPAPSVGNGLNLLAVTGFGNLSALALAPPGTALWNTTYGNFAPRIGVAYQLRQSAGWGTVLRGGYGIFYDLADQQVGDAVNALQYPFSVDNIFPGAPFPLPAAQQLPPPFTPQPNPLTNLVAFDPHMKLPYSHEWNFGVEQSLGPVQALTLSYVGQAGRRLLLQQVILGPTNLIGPFGQENLVQNAATSNYNALQLQFQRRLSHGLQALASYTYSHSIDEGSGAAFDSPNLLAQGVAPQSNRGPSDFDIRHSFTAAFTYEIPSPSGAAMKALLGGWAVDSDIRARSAPPVTVFFSGLTLGPNVLQVRPDVVPGVPLYLTGPQVPGGKALNPAAFMPPPIDPMTMLPTRQGDLARNALRGFGATQLDFTVHRQFDVREWFHLQFRAEFFNLLNHPNFGPPQPDLTKPFFGQATQMLATSLGQGMAGTGSFSPLYAIGGPRSIQLALKLMF